jgi:type II secretory pathway component PulF
VACDSASFLNPEPLILSPMISRSLSLEDIQHLSEEIRHLVQAGLPLEESLASAGQGRGERLQRVAYAISEGLTQGKSLQEIVEQESIGAPRMLASAVGAGVQSGDLGLTIELMGDFASDVVELRSRLLQSASYPLSIVLVAGLLLMVVVQNSLVRFLDTIRSWQMTVHPALLKILTWNETAPWWTVLLPMSGLVLLGFWSASGRASAMAFKGPERLLLLLPGVGALVRDLQYYTLTRMLSLLTERGLPLDESLVLAGGASGSTKLDAACRRLANHVKSGRSIADQDSSDRATGVSPGKGLPALLFSCLKQVELSENRMVHRLRSVADFYRNRLERNSTWMKLLMPIAMFIVIGGGCVLLYSGMVFWPLSELYRNLGDYN